MTTSYVIPAKHVFDLIRERESIISVTYKFLDSRSRGNDNFLLNLQLND